MEKTNNARKEKFLLGGTVSLPDPFRQFTAWNKEVRLAGEPEPDAMHLATVGEDGKPSGRMVLLKKFTSKGLVFFTNYHSRKGEEIDSHPYVALTFHWKMLERQVRITGKAKKVPARQSDEYFRSRPEESRISAIISPQSAVIDSREELQKRWDELYSHRKKSKLQRPSHWGGYLVIPESFEFWQGHEYRLHDRILYSHKKGEWIRTRLAP